MTDNTRILQGILRPLDARRMSQRYSTDCEDGSSKDCINLRDIDASSQPQKPLMHAASSHTIHRYCMVLITLHFVSQSVRWNRTGGGARKILRMVKKHKINCKDFQSLPCHSPQSPACSLAKTPPPTKHPILVKQAVVMATELRNPGTELWPQIVDHLAREHPNAAYSLWPVASDSYDAGFYTITYSHLSNIVNGLAWWIVKQLGPGKDVQQEVLTYIGSNDVRLTAMILATVKAGYAVSRKPVCPKPRPVGEELLAC